MIPDQKNIFPENLFSQSGNRTPAAAVRGDHLTHYTTKPAYSIFQLQESSDFLDLDPFLDPNIWVHGPRTRNADSGPRNCSYNAFGLNPEKLGPWNQFWIQFLHGPRTCSYNEAQMGIE